MGSPDPKFGYHIYWMCPVVVIAQIISVPVYWLKERNEKHRKNKFLRENPDAADMVMLAGIKIAVTKKVKNGKEV